MTETSVEVERVSAGAEPLRFHRLRYLDEGGDEITVGRLDQGCFVVLPREAAELVRQLEAGMSCADAASWYARTHGEDVDIADFVQQLDELGFLLAEGEQRAPASRPRWASLGRAVFSPVGALCYLALLCGAVLVMMQRPELAPRPRNLFFTHSLTLLMALLFLGQLVLVLVHESAHALAGRRLGLPSSLSLGRRFVYVVAETNLDGLVVVPRRQRVLPIMAGMMTDVAAVAALTLAAAGLPPSAIADYLLALAYLSCLRIVWQFWVFLQTDIYYLVVTVLGCVDLQRTAREYLRNALDRLLGRAPRHDPAAWHPRDHAAARWYSWVLVTGYAVCLATIPIGLLPLLTRTVSIVAGQLSGAGKHWLGAADAVAFLLLNVGQLGLAAWLARRERTSGAHPAALAAH